MGFWGFGEVVKVKYKIHLQLFDIQLSVIKWARLIQQPTLLSRALVLAL
jgi:hypothetical protein